MSFLKSGRWRGIRTPDPLVPNQMRYQAALFTDEFCFDSWDIWIKTGNFINLMSYLNNGVANEIRTRDHRNHNPGLYQLSYSHHYFVPLICIPEWHARKDSNLRPLAPEANALSNWATGACPIGGEE